MVILFVVLPTFVLRMRRNRRTLKYYKRAYKERYISFDLQDSFLHPTHFLAVVNSYPKPQSCKLKLKRGHDFRHIEFVVTIFYLTVCATSSYLHD